ncbi:polyunsaturated fatty acid 5-lipoxygenase-like [Polypterus senegalus]|uniref:polyunsaturated fatty acid 5-lipoxygenase-like n=1 Tax=Polypterus senegalus TaxID=55291 RepID=UPI0019651A6C|nr:polyunsaturated fatty acid 5-lipoxygenase-like [Polypterus senegalus]
MATYKLFVATGQNEYAGTMDYIYATVIGKEGQSETTTLDNFGRDHYRGCVGEYDVSSKVLLEDIWFVELEKRYHFGDNWFCRYVEVKCPDGTSKIFPCYRWFEGNMTIRLRESLARKVQDDTINDFHFYRQKELQERQQTYRWKDWKPGFPKCIDATSEQDIPPEHRFFNEKSYDFNKSHFAAITDLGIKSIFNKLKCWDALEDFQSILSSPSPIAAYVMENWKEDWFFGYQFLNGCNPRMIKSCSNLPENFPVTEDMVKPTLQQYKTTLKNELKAGNIYLVDYCILEGIPVNVINKKPQYITAPLCLLYDHPERGLIPLAIQIQQNPHEENPIFLPSDSELDWLLAKMWVRHADFQVYEALSHLLRTHLVCEVFCVATMRQLPAVHPVYKLLIPHMRDTLAINANARLTLISENGAFKKVFSIGGNGLNVLLQKECQEIEFKSLLPKADFEKRGVSQLKNYFYRDDCLKLWEAIESFVSDIVDLFYSSDEDVKEDKELQNWIDDAVTGGFEELRNFGLHRNIEDKKTLVTILTGVIFTSSAQHAAINSGQYDWCSWVPNTPCSMRCPPPPQKGLATMDLIMNTLPQMYESCYQVAITWVLSREQPEGVWLGQYPEDHFTEKAARDHIDKFQKALKKIEKLIDERNANRQLTYEYLNPRKIENSVAI